MSEGDHGIVPTKIAVAVPSTLPNGHPSANIFSGRGWWGVWRGYDIAGVGGSEFALQLVPHQRAAPFYRRTRTHTHAHTQYQSFHVLGVLLLMTPELCFVPAYILKGLVCRVFTWRVLLNCVMKLLCLVFTLQNSQDLHTMTLWSVGGAATWIMPTDLQHHRTLSRNITC